MFRSIITGSGSYIPEQIQTNASFQDQLFYTNGVVLPSSSADIVQKFGQITGISERRYAGKELTAADIGALAAKTAISDSGIDPETIDQLIVAHNFGNITHGSLQSVSVPSLASLVKHQLGISNPSCIAYDVLFGCPGWLQGVIQADAFFKAGIAKKALVIGTETLSRIIDPFDRDSMIFSDGAGAVVMEYQDEPAAGAGILSAAVQTHAVHEVNYIGMGPSEGPDADTGACYIKMKGRKVYEYALSHVPLAMKICLDQSGQPISSLKKNLHSPGE